MLLPISQLWAPRELRSRRVVFLRAHPTQGRPPLFRRPDPWVPVHRRRRRADELDAQLLEQDTYLALAENLESFLARLREKAEGCSVEERQPGGPSTTDEPTRVVARVQLREFPAGLSG